MPLCESCASDGPVFHDDNCTCYCHDELAEGDPPLAVFWAIRNDKGEYFKTSTSTSGPRWVKDLGTARIYSKLSHAKAKVTTYANESWNAGKPIPDIVEFIVNDVRVIDQRDRVAEVRAKKARESATTRQALHDLAVREARENAKKALAELAKLTGNNSGRKHEFDCGCKSCVGM
jgi:hypothetical protein